MRTQRAVLWIAGLLMAVLAGHELARGGYSDVAVLVMFWSPAFLGGLAETLRPREVSPTTVVMAALSFMLSGVFIDLTIGFVLAGTVRHAFILGGLAPIFFFVLLALVPITGGQAALGAVRSTPYAVVPVVGLLIVAALAMARTLPIAVAGIPACFAVLLVLATLLELLPVEPEQRFLTASP